MDLTLERDQESGQVEARYVSYYMFKLKYHSKHVSCFDLIFLKSRIEKYFILTFV